MCVAKLTWTQEADTKEITVDIVDVSIVKLALSYLYTGDYDDTEPAISKDFTDRDYTCSMSDAELLNDTVVHNGELLLLRVGNSWGPRSLSR